MPGLIGFTNADTPTLRQMRNRLFYGVAQHRDELFCDEKVSATRVHINILQPEPQPYVESEVCVWLDGEFYNREELGRSLGITPMNDPAFLLELYRREDFFSLLKKIDGIYAAVIYDETLRRSCT